MRKTRVNPGDKYNHVTVVEETPTINKRRRVLCKCDCGRVFIAQLGDVRRGHTKSCGKCQFANEGRRTAKTTHGDSHSKLYFVWFEMKSRCTNPKHKDFPKYGGRGIGVCPEWLDYGKFMAWARQTGYMPGLTVDRRDNDGDYCPGNCRWTSMSVQTRNKRSNRWLEFNGERMVLQDWARRIGINHATLVERLQKWPLERALTEPPRHNKKSKGAGDGPT